ncbi:MAG TPA: NupC/NupG family nucleoside CNT transporter [Gemmatimonadales bacterium]|nr:NupC/NupG family nucleoside CNT transporter [Gemmatimonadales bacterium]
MPMRGDPGTGGLRGALIAFAVIAMVIAGSWLIPGFAWRGLAAMERPAQADTTARDSVVGHAPPTVPGAEVQLPAGPAQAAGPVSLASRLSGLVGLALILALGILLSHNRGAIRWRVIAWGLGLQLLFAIFVLRIPAGQALFRWLGSLVTGILGYSYIGSEFVFGELGKQHSNLGVIFAFQLLPAIIFVSALFAILYYLGIMQLVVRAFAIVMSRVMGASGAESLNVAASIFMGQTEAPLTIRPFLARMTRSELMTVMTSGMAHISGSIMVAYIAFGIEARHLLTAVIMTAPGTIMMAKLLEPETQTPETYGKVTLDMPRQDVNLLDAAARGTGEGLQLMLNVIAMLVSFVALVALLNGGFAALHHYVDWFPANLQTVLGWIFRPIAWAMGVPWHDSGVIGSLLGTRMVLNEFIAYAQLGPMKGQLDPRSFTIASFALAGFANFSSVGIQLGGIGALVPDRKHDLARLGIRAMIAGTLANFLSATIAGILL